MLALIAGEGRLPAVLLENIADRNKRDSGEENLPFIAALEGHLPDGIVPDRVFRIEHLGTLLDEFRALGVREVCFAGRVARPAIDPGAIDAATMPLVPRMMGALQKGDDGALREVLAIFEDAGLTIRGAHEYAAALLPVEGTYSARSAQDAHKADAVRAAEVMAGIGPLDVGQSCVVQRRQVLAIEGKFGTDWMLASLQHRPGSRSDDDVAGADDPDARGGVFYKAAKPGQDRRIDLPVVGVDTIVGAKKARLDGVVVEENGVMVLDLAAVARAADELGLFFWVRRP